jgi:VWFA-related protein
VHHSRFFTLVTVIVTAATMGVAAHPSGRFAGSLEVRVVNLEAVVTDRDGQRVTGLGPQDFELRVDGQGVPIGYFTEIRDGRMISAANSTQILAPAVADLAEGARVPTNYLVFIDEFFPLKQDRDRAVAALAADLDRLGPGDAMAIIAYDGARLHRLCDWSSSAAELGTALEQAMNRPSGGFDRLFEAGNVESQLEIRQHAIRLGNQVDNALRASSLAMRAIGAPPGRKVVILMSGGWPHDPTMVPAMTRRSLARREGIAGSPELVEDLIDTANLLGYTIYGVDMPGLEAPFRGAAEYRGFSLDNATSAGRTGGELAVFTAGERANHTLLRTVSRATGGLPLLNAGVHHALGAPIDDTRTFYWLGFDARALGDDQRHQIKLVAKDPDLRIRTRQNYLDLSRAEELSMQTEASLLFASQSRDNEMHVVVGDAAKSGFGRIEVPLEIKIPLEGMMATAVPDGYEVRIELRIGALDSGGQVSDIPSVPVVFKSPEPPRPGSYGTYRTRLKLRRDDHDLVIIAYDPILDQTLTSRLELED